MILLWTLSPLGGQLALRLLSKTPSIQTFDSTIRYLPMAASLESTMYGASGIDSAWPSYGPIFMASLMTSRGQNDSSQDLYGTVKIPSLDRLGSGHVADIDSWTVLNYSQTIPYSSILGIPVVGVPRTGWLSFDLVSRYMAVNCGAALLQTNSSVFQNSSAKTGEGFADLEQGASFTIQSSENPFKTLFNISSANDAKMRNVSFASCSISPRDVQSSVYCRDQSCRVTAMKKLPVDFAFWRDHQVHEISMSLGVLPLATIGTIKHGTLLSSSLPELWLQDPDSTYDMSHFAHLWTLPEETLSRNFEIMFNTYWQSTFGSRFLFGNLSADMSLYNNISDSLLPFEPPIDFNTSQVTITKFEGQQYTCNIKFASLLIAISCILFLISITSLILETRTLAPDILGYVSSFTRDNPFATCSEASYLNGLQRAKALNEMKVLVGDVQPGSESGYAAVAATDRALRLQRNRLYT